MSAQQRLVVIIRGEQPLAQAAAGAVAEQTVPALLDVTIQVLPHASLDALSSVMRRRDVDFVAHLDAGQLPAPGWLRAGIDALRADPTLGAATPSDGATGAVLDVPSGSILRAAAWRQAGGWERDVHGALRTLDAGWRLWLVGYRVRAVPGVQVGADPTTRDGDVPAGAVDDMIVRLLDELPAGVQAALRKRTALLSRRLELQDARRRPDGELLPLVARACADSGPRGRAVLDGLERLEATGRCGDRRRVVVATADTIADRMAGPAIRATTIARTLAREHDVVLATTSSCTTQLAGVHAVAVDDVELERLVRWCDVFVFQGWVMAGRDFIRDAPAILVVDLYDPIHLEQLEQLKDEVTERGKWRLVLSTIAMLDDQLRRGDFFLCASEKQRGLWLGQLGAARRVNPVTYDGDPSLRSLIDVVPFGLDPVRPTATRQAIRGVMPGIGADDLVIVWGGGVYEWFDPLILLRAVDRLRHDHPTLRLVFMGMRHPNAEIPEMPIATAVQKLADELGLVPKHVIFNDWVAYDDRQNFLLEADIGISTHHDHVETEFSFRTRILDYLWARLPIVTTAGDAMGDLVEAEDLGVTAPPGDLDALVAALDVLLRDAARRERCRANIERVVSRFDWTTCLTPLVAFCAHPRRSPDLACTGTEGTVRNRPPEKSKLLARDVALLRAYYRTGGARLILNRLGVRARRVVQRR
jgi:glycosyltransferase involved in cell wall biosynthesis